MILADVNVLVYAFDSDSPHHEAYSAWLGETLAEREEFALVDSVLSGFVRVVTHPRIMPRPAPTGRAAEFVAAIAGAPRSVWLPASPAVWRSFGELAAADKAIKGNLVPDAYLAAVALANGARVATADRGFARFAGLRWFDPVS